MSTLFSRNSDKCYFPFPFLYSLLACTQLIRNHIEGDDRENEMLEEELLILNKRLVNIKESKRTKLREMKVQFYI